MNSKSPSVVFACAATLLRFCSCYSYNTAVGFAASNHPNRYRAANVAGSFAMKIACNTSKPTAVVGGLSECLDPFNMHPA